MSLDHRGRSHTLTPDQLLGPLNDVEARYAPRRLFVEGDVELPTLAPRVSLIGARRASDAALKRTCRLAKELIAEGVTIVSGLAEGIDTAAHTTAIEQGGRTIAVIGTPLDVYYPPKNRNLQDLIAREHLLVSQFEIGIPTQPRNFPQRNRTMALISHASVIIEASESSGSLSQGWETLRLGRPLFLLRSILENPSLDWPKQMLDYGATILTRTEDVLEVIPSCVTGHAEYAF